METDEMDGRALLDFGGDANIPDESSSSMPRASLLCLSEYHYSKQPTSSVRFPCCYLLWYYDEMAPHPSPS